MKTLVIGDVHGCSQELDDLLALSAPDRVVFVGDLYTKGPDAAGVHARLLELGAVSVLGNHDYRLLQVVDGRRPDDEHGHAVAASLSQVDAGWVERLRRWPFVLQVGPFCVTHAALHPSGDLARTTPAIHLFTRRWPHDRNLANPFWWQLYTGPPVIFGHDAVRGLVRRDRDGAPWVVGLDTGCVYGRQLSGWWVEAGQLEQVPARRTYRDVFASSSEPGGS